jgi:ferredoxin
VWEAKDPAVKSIIAGEYRIEIVAPELTPRDTLELASTAINLVQNRIWSAERAMDRVGVEDPIGEKELIRDEQTDATLNPAAVATMTKCNGTRCSRCRCQISSRCSNSPDDVTQEQALNAQRTMHSGVPGDESLNQPENQAQLPPEATAANAAAPGEENLRPSPDSNE